MSVAQRPADDWLPVLQGSTTVSNFRQKGGTLAPVYISAWRDIQQRRSLNGKKWSVDKCSEVEWSTVKWSDGLSNRLSTIIRIYIYNMKFASF